MERVCVVCAVGFEPTAIRLKDVRGKQHWVFGFSPLVERVFCCPQKSVHLIMKESHVTLRSHRGYIGFTFRTHFFEEEGGFQVA